MTPLHRRTNNPLLFERRRDVLVVQGEKREGVRRGRSRGGEGVGGEVREGEMRREGVGELVVFVAADEVGLE